MSLPASYRLKETTALFLAAMVLLLGGAGVSPELHSALHGQAETACESPRSEPDKAPSPQADAFCAVHLLQAGATWSVTPPLPQPIALAITYPAEASRTAPKARCPLPGNRGPPMLGIASYNRVPRCPTCNTNHQNK